MKAMQGLRRIPGLILGLVAFQLAIAGTLAHFVRVGARQDLAGHGAIEDGRLLYALADLLSGHPGLLAGFTVGGPLVAGLSLVGWAMLGPYAACRLAGQPAPMSLELWGRTLLPTLGITAALSLARVVVVGVGVAIATLASPWLALAVFGTLGAMFTVATDFAITEIVLARATFLEATRRCILVFPAAPRRVAAAALVALSRWALAAVVAAVAVGTPEPGTMWLARALVLATTVLGLLRLALAVEHVSDRIERRVASV